MIDELFSNYKKKPPQSDGKGKSIQQENLKTKKHNNT
jgi:hypothetical protein